VERKVRAGGLVRPLEIWRDWANEVTGQVIDSHFLAEKGLPRRWRPCAASTPRAAENQAGHFTLRRPPVPDPASIIDVSTWQTLRTQNTKR
jgi:hypothetical protein